MNCYGWPIRVDGPPPEWDREDDPAQEAAMTARHAEGTASAQRELWGRRARDWAAIQEGQARPLFEAGLEALEIGPGSRVLDIVNARGLNLNALKTGFRELVGVLGILHCAADAAYPQLHIATDLRGHIAAHDHI